MRILYVNWECLGAEDAVEILKRLGHEIGVVQLSEESHNRIDWDFVEKLKEIIGENVVDIVFSFNYFPTLAEACKENNSIYVSWVYDNPAIKVYSPTINYSCNRIFIFDSYMCNDLKKRGAKNVYYMPLAVNTKRLDKIQISVTDKEEHSCDVSFVGGLYNETNNLYDRLIEKIKNPHLEGYLQGIIQAQKKIYGYNFLQECINESTLQSIYQAMPFELEKGSYADLAQVYADYFLCRKLAEIERYEIVDLLSQRHKFHLYTHKKDVQIGKAINKGPVNYFDEMIKVFKLSKINLNISLRSIRSGIPLRAIDIMGNGGFLLTNYQEDFQRHFEAGVDFVYYESMQDLQEKVEYYSRHDEERKRIAQNGYNKVKETLSYEKILRKMLSIACKD